MSNNKKENDMTDNTATELSVEERAVQRAVMQVEIDVWRVLKDELTVLQTRLADLKKRIDGHGYSLYGEDYDPEDVG